MRIARGILVLWLLAACGTPAEGDADAGSGPADAGAVADAGTAGGCPAGERTLMDGGCAPVGWSGCPAGFVAAESGWGCDEVMPAEPCAPGSMAVLGESRCQPVGVEACPAGFEPDPSGWGCRAVLPAEGCEGATKQTLGESACVAIGDCSAPFPPAGATLLVDDDFTPAELDATHFASLADALAAAGDGALVAVEAGVYAGPLTVRRPVRIAGRCAERVVLEGGGVDAPGIAVTGAAAAGVEISGISVRGFKVGVQPEYGAGLLLRDSLVEGNRLFGLMAVDSGTTVRVVGSALRDNLADATGRFGHGATAGFGASLELVDCDLAGNHDAGASVQNPGSRARLERCVVRDSLPRADGTKGLGLVVITGASLELVESAVLRTRAAALNVLDSGSSASLERTVLDGVELGRDANGAQVAAAVAAAPGTEVALAGCTLAASSQHGLYVDGARATLTRSVIRAAGAPGAGPGSGASSLAGAELELIGSAIVEAASTGLYVAGQSQARLADTLILATRPIAGLDGSGSGISVAGGSSIIGDRVGLDGNAGAALHLGGAGSGATLRAVAITDTAPFDLGGQDGLVGLGIFAKEGTRLEVTGGLVRGNAFGGVVLAGALTRASLTDTLVRETGPAPDGSGGAGILVQEGAQLVLERAGVVDNVRVGLIVSGQGSLLTARQLLVAGTRLSPFNLGRGVHVQTGATAAFSDTAIVGNAQLGVLALHAGTRIELAESLVARSLVDADGELGHGLVAMAARADLSDTELAGNPGIGALFASGSGVVTDCRFDANAVALHVQGDSTLREVQTAPDEAAGGEVAVTASTRFTGNGARLGEGVVPLPAPLDD